MKLLLVLTFTFFYNQVKSDYSCPVLDCTDKPRDDGLCFKHSGTNPANSVLFYPCSSGKICDLDYNKDELAWVNST